MANHVYFAASQAEADAIAAAPDARASDSLVVAASPWQHVQLKRLGIPCNDTVPYLDRRAHLHGSRHMANIRQLIEQSFHPDLGDGLSATHTNRFSFWFLYRYRSLLCQILIMDGLDCQNPGATWHPPCETDSVPLASRLHQMFCQTRALHVEALGVPQQHPGAVEAPRASRPLRMLNKLTAAIVLSRVRRKRPTLLMATPAMHMSRLACEIRQDYPHVEPVLLRYQCQSSLQELGRALYWLLALRDKNDTSGRLLSVPLPFLEPDTAHPEDRRALQHEINSFICDHRQALGFGSIDLASLLLDDVDWLLAHLAEYGGPSGALTRVLDAAEPELVMSPSSGQVFYMLGDLAAQRGIPAIVIPFKSLAAPQSEEELPGALQIGADMLTDIYPIAVAQSPSIAAYATYSGYRGRIVRTPPLLRTHVDLARRTQLRQRLTDSIGPYSKLVLYAPSMKLCPPLYVVHTLDEVIRCMADLIEATRDRSSTRLMIRLHPDLASLTPDFPNLIPMDDHVVLDSGTQDSFSDVLPMADLVVTNMSTVADEAVINHLPALLYDPWARHNHLNAPPITGSCPQALSPAYYLSDQAALASSLDWLLSNHAPDAMIDKALYAPYHFPETTRNNLSDLLDTFLR